MAEYKKGGRFGGKKGGFKGRGDRPAFGGKSRFARAGHDEERVMHPAVCSRCSKACEVPFRPNGEKPVLCRDCFRTDNPLTERDGGYPKRKFGAPTFVKPQRSTGGDNDLKKQLELVNSKLDKLIQLLKEAGEKVS